LSPVQEDSWFCAGKIILAGRHGTPMYSAPELVQGIAGDSVKVTAKADVFSAGRVMLQLCTPGQSLEHWSGPGGKRKLSSVMTAAKEGREAPAEAGVQLDSELAAVIRGCLRACPTKRWSTSRAIGALEKLAESPDNG
jgi:serine/threonine protein kinase